MCLPERLGETESVLEQAWTQKRESIEVYRQEAFEGERAVVVVQTDSKLEDATQEPKAFEMKAQKVHVQSKGVHLWHFLA